MRKTIRRSLISSSLRPKQCFAFMTLAGLLAGSGCGPRTPINPDSIGDIHGSLHARLADQTYTLSDFTVFLEDGSGTQVASALTDARGRYLFQSVPGGLYELCWNEPGWVPDCASDLITVENNINYPPSQTISPNNDKSERVVAGQVTLLDGATPAYREPFFDIENEITVVAVNSSGAELARTTASPNGHYVLANMPQTGFRVRADMTGLSTAAVTVAAGDDVSVTPITVNNYRPHIISMQARPAQFPYFLIQTGQTLTVRADVTDQDDSLSALTYHWKPAPQNGEIVSTNGNQAIWRLDNRPGPKTIYLSVEDGKGGFAMDSVSINAGQTATTFAGQVMDSAGVQLTNANVSVNVQAYNLNEDGAIVGDAPLVSVTERPVSVRTDESGQFVLPDVPIGERYVLNVTAPGKVPISRILRKGNIYAEYRLTDAFVTEIDPGRAVSITDERKRERASHQAVSVRLLRPDSLVPQGDASFESGPVRVEIASLDITRNEMPGDYTTLLDGELTGLKSFGAVNVDFFDAGGNALQLRDGARAEVTISAPEGAKDLPEEVPLYYYDDMTGLWVRYEEMAKYDPETNAYIGRVDHFSSVNVDAPLTDTSCVRLLSDNLSTALGLKARFAFPSLSNTYDVPIDEALSVLRRIPPNETGSTVTILDSTDTVVTDVDMYVFDFAGGQTQLPEQSSVFSFTSGNVVAANFTLARPYPGCQTLSVRRTSPGAIDFTFLERSHGVGSNAKTIGYYKGLDPAMNISGGTWSGGTHATLGDWWAASGFSNTGAVIGSGTPGVIDNANAAYMNYNDLGFGRNMTIRKDVVSGNDRVFAYVSNHGDVFVNNGANQNPLNANFAATGANGFATVVMESTLVNGVENVVTFFVYGGTDASAPLINSADLDGLGQKFVPGLCQVCHGGAVYNPANVSAPSAADLSLRPSPSGIGASFREFDLESYVFFPPVQGPGSLTPAEEAEFFKLNQLVKDSRPQPNIIDLVDGWYGGVSLNAAGDALIGAPDYLKPPAGWAFPADEVFYTNVVGKSCRTCHIAYDGNGSANDISWHSEAEFKAGFSQYLVCDITNDNLMPHALMTYRNFWLEGMGPPYEPDAFAAYTGQTCE